MSKGRGIADRGQPCRHCQKKKISRARSLCWKCYYTPGVRDLYPSTSKFVKRGLHGGDFNSPSLPPEPIVERLDRESYFAVLCQRAEARQSIFHDDDLAPSLGEDNA